MKSQEIQVPRLLPSCGVTFGHIENVLRFAGHHFSDGHERLSESIQSQVADIAEAMSALDGLRGCFGLGYPYYAVDQRLGLSYRVPEIGAFVAKTTASATYARTSPSASWPCVECQTTTQLPDLKTNCKPCEKTLFRPRDLFKALPDIDVVLVLDTETRRREQEVETLLVSLGLRQSDTDIRGSVNSTILALAGVEGEHVPVDAHIWNLDEFRECCLRIQAAPLDTNVIINSRSLHTKWEDNPVNFWFDFVFSLTEVGVVDPELQRLVDDTRRALVSTLGSEGLESATKRASGRARLILDDPNMRNVFLGKVSSWRC